MQGRGLTREQGKLMPAEANRRAMAYFGTIGVTEEEMKAPEERTGSSVNGLKSLKE